MLATIEESTGYDEVLNDSIELEIDGSRVRVLSLERVIRAKEFAGRPKDLAVLPALRATLEQIRARDA